MAGSDSNAEKTAEKQVIGGHASVRIGRSLQRLKSVPRSLGRLCGARVAGELSHGCDAGSPSPQAAKIGTGYPRFRITMSVLLPQPSPPTVETPGDSAPCFSDQGTRLTRLPGFDRRLQPIVERVHAGERLSREDGLLLYETRDIWTLCALADVVRRRLHGDVAYYNVNRHLNYSNVCALSCTFCAFHRKRGRTARMNIPSITCARKCAWPAMPARRRCTLWAACIPGCRSSTTPT